MAIRQATSASEKNGNWKVYILLCSDGSLYTGITNNIKKRLARHASGKGAKYLRGRGLERTVYLEDGHNRSSAARREAEIKKMRRPDKWLLIESYAKRFNDER